MSEELKITKERVLSAAGKCGTAKEVLKELFPEVFAVKEEWEDVTNQYRADYGIMDKTEGLYLTDGSHWPILVLDVAYSKNSALSGMVKVEKGRIWRKK